MLAGQHDGVATSGKTRPAGSLGHHGHGAPTFLAGHDGVTTSGKTMAAGSLLSYMVQSQVIKLISNPSLVAAGSMLSSVCLSSYAT